MADEIHVIDLRLKCVLMVLRHVLLVLMKYSCHGNKHCKSKHDLGVGMAEIYTANEKTLKKKKTFNKKQYKDKIYDETTGKLKTSFNVEDLDFTFICDLLLAKTFSTLSQDICCKDCKHECYTCGYDCHQLATCKYKSYSGCGCSNDSCPFLNYKIFIALAKALRNINAHETFSTYEKFSMKTYTFQFFPLSHNWDEIWSQMFDATKFCLSRMFVNHFIDKATLEEKEVDLRIARRKEKDFLIPIVCGFIKEFHRSIDQKGDIYINYIELQTIQKKLSSCLKGNSTADEFWYEDKMISFLDKENDITILDLKSNSPSLIIFTSKIVDDFKMMFIQIRKIGESWFQTPCEMYTISQTGADFELCLSELDPTTSYSVRLFGVDDTKKQYVLTYKEFKPAGYEQCIKVQGKTIFISSEKRLVIEQKKQNGVIFEQIPEIKTENVFAIQYQTDNITDKDWSDVAPAQYVLNSGSLLELSNLPFMECNVRVILHTEDGNYQLLSLNGIHIVGKHDLEHYTRNSKKTVLAYFHGFGLANDLHHLIERGNFTDVMTKVVVQQRGRFTTDLLSEALNYLDDNFGEEKVVVFRCSQDKDEEIDRILELFVQYFKDPVSKHILFVGYDMVHHLNCVRISAQLLNELDLRLTKELNSHLLVFNGEINTMINVYICQGSSRAEMLKAYKGCHDQLKALVLTGVDILENGAFGIAAIILFPQLTERQVEEFHFCKCEPEKCCLFTMSSDHLQNSKMFHEKINTITAMIHNDLLHNKMKYTESPTKEIYYQLVNRLMVVSSLANIQLPTAFGSIHEKITTLVLNRQQKHAIDSTEKKKLIQGPYGCGKTMVLQKIIEKFLAKLKEEGMVDQWVYYITFDEYSLLHCENERFQQMLEEKYENRIVCMSLQEITEEAGFASMLSLEECFEYLSSKHSSEKVNMFIDELDADFLTTGMALNINQLWTQPCYLDSTIVICFQSILKERASDVTGNAITRECFDMSDLNAQLFSLPIVVRYSTKIFCIVEIVQKFVEKRRNFYVQPEAKEEEISEENIVRSRTESLNLQTETDRAPMDFDSFDHDIDCVDCKPLPQTSIDLDTLAKLSSVEVPHGISSEESGLISTSFMFPGCNGCGHKYQGEEPTLVRFDRDDPQLAGLVATAITNTVNPRWKNSLVICNDIVITRQVSSAFRALGVTVVEYLDALELKYPLKELKERIYRSWFGKTNCALFTNNRGCRGIQHDQVLILLDENEDFQHFLLPEMISRSTTNVTFFVFGSHRAENQSPQMNTTTVKEIMNHLEEEQLVNVRHFTKPDEQIHCDLNLEEKEKHDSDNSFANLLACKRFESTYEQLFSINIKKAKQQRRDGVYNRAFELAKYVIEKDNGRTDICNTIGDNLYRQCIEVLELNRNVFNRVAEMFFSFAREDPTQHNSRIFRRILSIALKKESSFGSIVSIYTFCLRVCKSLPQEDLTSQAYPYQEAVASVLASHSEWISRNGGLDAILNDKENSIQNSPILSFWVGVGAGVSMILLHYYS